MNGKQLKNSILQWAIQGKLVPQDPNDEPASVLLERIRVEKARLVKEGKIKKDKNESIIYKGDDNSYYEKFPDGKVVCIDEEIPFEIPEGWEWCRLQDVCSYIQRGKSPIYSDEKMFPVIAQKCNQWAGFSIEKAQFINPDTINKYTEDRILQDHDLLWNSTGLGTLGRMAIYEEIKNPYKWAVADSHVTVIRPLHKFVSYDFLYAYFASPTVQNVIEDKSEGSTKQKELYVDTVKTYLIPLPPFAEQNKISERINFVLPVVSRYDEWQIKLDTLNEEIRTKLQKSVLQEAIKGRLVPQNPLDEPASILLERIETEKQNLMKDGKFKAKDAVSSTIYKGDDNKYYEQIGSIKKDITDAIPYEIPDSWAFTRLSAVIELLSGRDLEPSKYNSIGKGIPYITGASNIEESITVSRWTEYPTTISHMGDLLITCKGTVGTMAINNIGNIHIARQIMSITSILCDIDYIRYVIESQMVFLKKEARSMIPGISREHILELILPLPPLGEQARIVNRIKEMQALLN